MSEIRPFRTINRRKSRQINVGKVLVGGDAPISVQSMTASVNHVFSALKHVQTSVGQ